MFGWKLLVYFIFGLVLSKCQCLDMWQCGILTGCVLVNGWLGYLQRQEEEEE